MDVAQAYDYLAVAFKGLGKYDKAEERSMMALETVKRVLPHDVGSNARQLYAEISNNLASLYIETGRYESALPFLDEATKIDQELLGNDHPWLGVDLLNVAAVQMALARYVQADKYYAKALELLNNAFGAEQSLIGRALTRKAALKLIQGEDELARKHADRALEILVEALGENSVRVAFARATLAEILSQQGKFGDAEAELGRAEQILHQRDKEHPDLVRVLTIRAATLSRQGRYQDAVETCERARIVAVRALPVGHPLVAELDFQEGIAKSALGNNVSALRLLKSAGRLFEQRVGSVHPKLSGVHMELGRVLQSQGDSGGSQKEMDVVTRMRESFPGINVVTAIDL